MAINYIIMAKIYKSKSGNRYRIVEVTFGNGEKKYCVEQNTEKSIRHILGSAFRDNPIVVLLLLWLFFIIFTVHFLIGGGWEDAAGEPKKTIEEAKTTIDNLISADNLLYNAEQEALKKKRDQSEVSRKTI